MRSCSVPNPLAESNNFTYWLFLAFKMFLLSAWKRSDNFSTGAKQLGKAPWTLCVTNGKTNTLLLVHKYLNVPIFSFQGNRVHCFHCCWRRLHSSGAVNWRRRDQVLEDRMKSFYLVDFKHPNPREFLSISVCLPRNSCNLKQNPCILQRFLCCSPSSCGAPAEPLGAAWTESKPKICPCSSSFRWEGGLPTVDKLSFIDTCFHGKERDLGPKQMCKTPFFGISHWCRTYLDLKPTWVALWISPLE